LDKACLKIKSSCQYFKNIDKYHNDLGWDLTDIEDLAKVSKQKCICPFYTMRKRVEKADIIFMPYNYLIG